MVYKLTTHIKHTSSTVQYLTSMSTVLHELRILKYDSADVSVIDNTNIRCAFVRWRTIMTVNRSVKHEKEI